MTESLENIIRQYVHLEHANAKGWFAVLCRVCMDHGKKGKRASFSFDDEHVGYHCFNCGAKAIYDPNENKVMPKNMIKVLDAFGIPYTAYQQLILDRYGSQKLELKTKETAVVKIEPHEIALPDIFYKLEDVDDEDQWAMIANYYLTEVRGIDPTSYPFMLSTRTKEPRLKKWYKRLIIPIYKNGKLIFFQGRDLTNKAIRKYESPPIEKDKILYGYDKLFEKVDQPLYIVEGIFDAMSIDCVAVLGNVITPEQIIWLNKSPRKKIYIPDRFGDGKNSAIQALELGWSIATLDPNGEGKDINDAVNEYGLLFVLASLAKFTRTGFAAETLLGIYCK